MVIGLSLVVGAGAVKGALLLFGSLLVDIYTLALAARTRDLSSMAGVGMSRYCVCSSFLSTS